MFKHILVPTDGSQLSQDTARRAISFAKETGARITAFFAKPEYLTPVLHRIVKKIGNRECYWVAPALWKPDQTGYIEGLRAQVGPCKFFDSTKVNIARAGDHIHPTDEGGEAWGEAFWEFFKRERAGSARGSP